MSSASPSKSSRTPKPESWLSRLNDDSQLARATPAGLARYTSQGVWKLYPHLHLLTAKLMQVAAGEIRRLAVMMPPGHGKSYLISRYFPAWYLGTFPERRIILTSYEADTAAKWGRDVRDILHEYGQELFGVRLASKTASWLMLEGHEGYMVTAGVMGPITGKRAEILIIDDPVRNMADAYSETYRERTWDWYLSTASTRLTKEGSVVIVMTRWHEDDLLGRLLKADRDGVGEGWEILRLKAIADQDESVDDMFERKAGDALCPSMFPKSFLAPLRASKGPYIWSALYQQEPSPEAGGIFKRDWFRYYHGNPGEDRTWVEYDDEAGSKHRVEWGALTRFITVDLAASTKEVADYTVAGVFGMTREKLPKLFLLDLVRSRIEGPDIVPMLRRLMRRWRPTVVGIEKVGFQLALIQQARREGLPVRELEPDRDKVARALAATPLFEAGRIYFRHGALWLEDLERELLQFPTGEHDDQVDVLAYASTFFHTVPFLQPVGREPDADEDGPRDPFDDVFPKRSAF